jgi:hypothetical protein
MSSIAEKFKGTVLHCGVGGATETFSGYLPTAGVSMISFLIPIKMGAGTDMTITIKTADSAAGSTPVALTEVCPVYRDGVKQTSAKAVTETAATGSYFHVIEVPAGIIPAGKYIGAYADAGSGSNLFGVIALEDTYYKG